ncbi:hypothetical protein PPERSA_02284 [Pseudocohnilembus persalinus]|uniref:AB hydrolase-1 domain-containing protein n=1 Tax=Pseudocohnilembus persalinus TaxID=266149 RepID=A0A0V0QKW2_PSEPJ|nr:hypothetical protein PPERSA_02284 [Pseudocohnilembus persalinus]|eukprot:KRX02794.1 hypothetical protein PPERSA_02284 [Pseudocohnilembus persalinus]
MNCLQQDTKNQPEILTKEENETYQKERQKLLQEKQLEKLKLELNSKLFKETEVYEWRCIEKFTGFFVNSKHTKPVKKCEKNNKDKKQKNNDKNDIQQKEQNQEQNKKEEEKEEDEIKILDPIIELNDNSYQWIHTYECGFQNEEIIVLLHGYAGCAMTYVRGLKQLAGKYHVFAIDMLGFGMSSRPSFNITDPKIIEYMVESIEKWRLKMIPDKKFNLCGHSYGGYISAMYGIKYAQHLKNLILLSPIGTTEYSQEQVQEREKQMLQNFGFTKKILFSKIKSSYSERTGPTRWLNKFYMPTNYIIGRYFSKRLGLPKEEVDLWQKFMRQQFKFNESTEKGFFDLFLFPVLAAKFPLCKELLKLKDQKLPEKEKNRLKEKQQTKLFKKTQSLEWQAIEKFSGLLDNNNQLELHKKDGNEIKNNVQIEDKWKDKVKIYNVEIQIKDESYQWIHTLEMGFENEEIMVLTHGYAGCALNYLRCFKQLAKKYHVFAIDFIGFGLSSRPNFELTETKEIIQFMLDSVEVWRKKVIPEKKFVLCGHSYGGYISGMYSSKYPQFLNGLVLISPVGCYKYSDQEIKQYDKNLQQNKNFMEKLVYGIMKNSYNDRRGPTKWLNSVFVPSNFVLKKMDQKGAELIYKNQIVQSTYTLIQDSNHQIVFEQPRLLAEKILERLEQQKNKQEIGRFKIQIDKKDNKNENIIYSVSEISSSESVGENQFNKPEIQKIKNFEVNNNFEQQSSKKQNNLLIKDKNLQKNAKQKENQNPINYHYFNDLSKKNNLKISEEITDENNKIQQNNNNKKLNQINSLQEICDLSSYSENQSDSDFSDEDYSVSNEHKSTKNSYDLEKYSNIQRNSNQQI